MRIATATASSIYAKGFSMGKAKDIVVKVISSKDANRIIKQIHYSGTVVNNSSLHFGIFLDGKCGGAMSYGSSMDKRKVINLVEGTGWNGFIELNRMAFADWLPRNSESRAIAYSLKFIKKHYPHIEWVLSFADGTQCGDGAIYRASGFHLTKINRNTSIIRLPCGKVACNLTFTQGHYVLENGGKSAVPKGSVKLPGYQLRYIYFLNKEAKERLTVPILPYSAIDEAGARMYKGRKIERVSGVESGMSDNQLEGGGANPTGTLQ